MTKRLNLWNSKGGVGKTTLALQLAAFYSEDRKKKVLVVDLEKTLTAKTRIDQGKIKADTATSIPVETDADIMIVDYPAGSDLLPDAGLCVVPLQASSFDFEKALEAVAYLERHGKEVVKVLSLYDSTCFEDQDLRAYLKEKEGYIFTVPSWKIFRRTAGAGVSVFHPEEKVRGKRGPVLVKNISSYSKAKNIIGFLGQELWKKL